jgi:hypothetical protein
MLMPFWNTNATVSVTVQYRNLAKACKVERKVISLHNISLNILFTPLHYVKVIKIMAVLSVTSDYQNTEGQIY